MEYSVSLKITYDYPVPASNGRHLLRLMPAHIPGRQVVQSGHLDISPKADERSDQIDFFGNVVTDAAYYGDHHHVQFHMTATLSHLGPAPLMAASPHRAHLMQDLKNSSDLTAHSPLHFLNTSPYVRMPDEIKSFAAHDLHPEAPVLEIVKTIGHRIFKAMTFNPAATSVSTPMEEAFQHRHGVCQDFTHIMIACLRSLGIPAGYVSGFIRTIPPEGETRLEGADAMHAWVRAWCGNHTGWVEFDPTNNILAGADHIVVGYGRDYDDVAPVKGVLKGFGEQVTTQAVDVIPL